MTSSAENPPGPRRGAVAGRLPPSQLGVHLADADTADAIMVHSGGSGLIIGVNPHGQTIRIMLFRREPTVVLAVGSVQLAQLIGFRAIAIGARIRVQTGRPAAWTNFADECARMITHEVDVELAEVATQPELVVVDTDSSAVAHAEPASGAAWSTVLTVRRELSDWDAPSLSRADLALMQRLSAPEARLVCSIMNVPEYERAMTELPDDVVALISHSKLRWARISETTIERRLIGPIDRFVDMPPMGVDRIER